MQAVPPESDGLENLDDRPHGLGIRPEKDSKNQQGGNHIPYGQTVGQFFSPEQKKDDQTKDSIEGPAEGRPLLSFFRLPDPPPFCEPVRRKQTWASFPEA